MDFKLYSITGYAEAIIALRMSKQKFYSWEKAQKIRELVYCLTTIDGGLATYGEYIGKIAALGIDLPPMPPSPEYYQKGEVSGDYEHDVEEFKRLLTLTFNNAMKDQKHHTLMKYIDISFITHGLHRGGQDDLDSHALAFQNRITRESTRLENIQTQKKSEWYKDKIMPFGEAINTLNYYMPDAITTESGVFKRTELGYVNEKYADMAEESGLRKDVMRGLINLSFPSSGLWKINLFDLRHVYRSRSKVGTKANPELKDGIEQLAEQVTEKMVVFGEFFTKEYTSSKEWVHMNNVRTITRTEFDEFKKWKKEKQNEQNGRIQD